MLGELCHCMYTIGLEKTFLSVLGFRFCIVLVKLFYHLLVVFHAINHFIRLSKPSDHYIIVEVCVRCVPSIGMANGPSRNG